MTKQETALTLSHPELLSKHDYVLVGNTRVRITKVEGSTVTIRAPRFLDRAYDYFFGRTWDWVFDGIMCQGDLYAYNTFWDDPLNKFVERMEVGGEK